MFQNINILILNRTILISSSRHSDLIDVLREVNTTYQDFKSETKQVFTDAQVLPLHTLDNVLDIRLLMIFHNGSSSAYAMYSSQLCVCDSRHNPNIRTCPPESLDTQPSCPSTSCSSSCRSCCSREIQTGKVVETNIHAQHVGI